jgi:hypothetical protein
LVVVGVAGLLFALLNVPAALAQPANDDFDTPTVISALPFTDSISTADATTAGDDPFCNGNEHTVWYSFSPTQDTPVKADTACSDYATTLGVYTDSRGALSEVACASSPAEVTFKPSPTPPTSSWRQAPPGVLEGPCCSTSARRHRR